MNTKHRIDFHQHVVPPFWASDLPSHGGDPSGWESPQWSPEAAINFMDSIGTTKGVLSLTAPSVAGWKGEERRAMARRVNNYTAKLVKESNGRFGNFATVPLPDVEGAVLEAKRALDELNAEGVVLLTNYEGKYLGDPAFEPLWKILNERSAIVFIHPGAPQIKVLPGMPGPMIDYPFDTTRTAVHMVANGVLDRYTQVKCILSHAGGFVPYTALRFAGVLSMLNPDKFTVDSVMERLRQFYFDTALTSEDITVKALLEFACPGHVLFGSNFPYAPAPAATMFTRQLDENSGISDSDKAAINYGNGKKLLSEQSRRQYPKSRM